MPREEDDLLDLLALHLTAGLGPARIAALLERFGSASAALRAAPAALAEVPGMGAKVAAGLDARAARQAAAEELRRAGEAGVRVVGRGRAGYPAWLGEVPGAPALLYLRGELTPADERAVALVGTRGPDAAGKRVARCLAGGLARAGVTVISGLARGIDGTAHRGALEAGGRTLAVLAGGLARVYPPEHGDLAEQVARQGALVAESAMDQEPLKGLFPARNRIISGLSRVVVIVQADADSGSLITARHAGDQGRTVMAVPGPVEGPLHDGCHRLLREGAVLCRGVDDILEELDGVSATARGTARPAPAPPAAAAAPAGLDEAQRRVWDLLAGGPRAVDEIAQQLGLGVPQLAGVLLDLEMRRAVRRLPGNRYERA